ncbi:hypothetical protein AB0J14_38345 [Micromonospora arborensis]|uniref:hypothetical protein n=1 Tax=Micromonospora arborensis TaxID=2116518 RepID=UPI0033E1826B
MIEETQPPKRRGRPATGVTTKRNVRIGAAWDRAEELALELARRDGTVRTRDGVEHGNVTAYVEEAIREHNARVEKRLQREQG